YGKDDRHRWPYAWYGVKGYFRWLESKAYKMHVRVLLSRYRAYTPCPDCGGKRFQPEALLYRMAMENRPLAVGKDQPNASGASSIASRQPSMTLADFYALPIRDALKLVETVAASRHLQTAGSSSPFSASSDPLVLALNEVRSRLGYLAEVGLGYLTLDRPTRSLSGGETERVNLTTCLGTRLVNTLFVLDEPSVGLHPRDTDRLVRILEHLRDAGNTVVVVEHEAGVIRAADAVVDLGPEQGERGGEVVFQGAFQELLGDEDSLTGQYLSGRKQIEIPRRRPVSVAALQIEHAARHNLKDLTVRIPLGRFVCITGVSGSGKTTLAREVLLPALEAKLKSQRTDPSVPKASERMDE
ncbi:MAG: excinuclease ABC subunit A, partial [Pedosphaera parvula]|nr:excinuclease ABC subunit A [Pedosphaera parvula]